MTATIYGDLKSSQDRMRNNVVQFWLRGDESRVLPVAAQPCSFYASTDFNGVTFADVSLTIVWRDSVDCAVTMTRKSIS